MIELHSAGLRSGRARAGPGGSEWPGDVGAPRAVPYEARAASLLPEGAAGHDALHDFVVRVRLQG
ncbi:hypothetical protein SXANM310S_05199 [Streptomyces xanthochromogenes]